MCDVHAKIKQTWSLSFEKFPQKALLTSVEGHCAKILVSVGQTYMGGDNVTKFTSH